MAATDEANTFRGEWVNKIFFFKGIPSFKMFLKKSVSESAAPLFVLIHEEASDDPVGRLVVGE